MSTRVIHRTQSFDRDIKHLSKKHRQLPAAIDRKLQELTLANDPSADGPLKGLKGLPVFKTRVAHGNSGKRGAARIIYYWDEALVMPMFAYVKNEADDVPEQTVLRALQDAGMVPEDEPKGPEK